MSTNTFKERDKVVYFGMSGYTQPCLLAISAILNSGVLPEEATIVTHVYDMKSHPRQEDHLFIFWNWHYVPVVVIPSGFASGYPGEGPNGFALAICMIREKRIPMKETFVEELAFNAIDKGKIKYADEQIFKEIKAGSVPCSWPWYDWVPENYEKALERGQLWRHSYFASYILTDPVSVGISNVDLFSIDAGRKLKLAEDKVRNSLQPEDWQNAGLLTRDAWIELSQRLCDSRGIDTSDVEKDKVVIRLKKLGLDDEIFSLAKASFDLSLKVQHDRRITRDLARSCVACSVFTMQSIVLKYMDPNDKLKQGFSATS